MAGCLEADCLGEEEGGPEAEEEDLRERRSRRGLGKGRLRGRAERVSVGVKHDVCALLLQAFSLCQYYSSMTSRVLHLEKPCDFFCEDFIDHLFEFFADWVDPSRDFELPRSKRGLETVHRIVHIPPFAFARHLHLDFA